MDENQSERARMHGDAVSPVTRLLTALVVALAIIGWQEPLHFQSELGSDGSAAAIGLTGAAIALTAAGLSTKYMRWTLWASAVCGLTVAFWSLPLGIGAGDSMEYVPVIAAFAFLSLMGFAAVIALIISIVPVPTSQHPESKCDR